jgi:transcriptional regulator with XRE-family HTH domain
MAGTSRAVARMELGLRMRQLRHRAGLTLVEVAGRLMVTESTVSRVESGRSAGLRTVRDLCVTYGVDQATTRELLGLARAARSRDELALYSTSRQGMFASLEQGATTITEYAVGAVPLLLRTAGYAVAAAAPGKPDGHRGQRQKLLTGRYGPTCRFLLDEAVLHRFFGSPQIMVNQLETILDVAQQQPRVSVHMVPYGAQVEGLAAACGFTILEFGTLPPVVFADTPTGRVERTVDLGAYQAMAQNLCDAAWDLQTGLGMIAVVQEGFQRAAGG